MKCWANAAAVLLFGHALNLAIATQVPLTITEPAHDFEPSPILDKNLNDTIAQILKEHSVPGYSLVLVRPRVQARVEYGAWGIRNEDGDPMTPQVRFLSNYHCLVLILLRHWLVWARRQKLLPRLRLHCCKMTLLMDEM
jgi:hypothetical protein